jgi:hypothetical protein
VLCAAARDNFAQQAPGVLLCATLAGLRGAGDDWHWLIVIVINC